MNIQHERYKHDIIMMLNMMMPFIQYYIKRTFTAETEELLIRLNRDFNITIVVTAEEPEALEEIADSFGIMDHGELRKELSADTKAQILGIIERLGGGSDGNSKQ